MKTYEAVFILDNRKIEDGGDAFARDAEKTIKGLGGTVKHRTPMGRRPFARPIGKHKAGTYWDFVFDMAPESVAEFQNRYRLNNTVLRLQVFIYEEPPKEEKVVS